MARTARAGRTATALAAVLCLGLAASLASCSSPRDIHLETPTASARTDTALPPAAPEPRVDIGCAGIAMPAALERIFDGPVAPVDPAASRLGAYPGMPPLFAVRSRGGISCEWSNGVPYSEVTGTMGDYSGVQVSVLPEADRQWERFAAYYGIDGSEQRYCTPGSPVVCYFNALVDEYWVAVQVLDAQRGPQVDTAAVRAAADAFFDPLVEALASSGPPGDAWAPPAGTVRLPRDCADLATAAEVGTAIGASGELVTSVPSGGWGLDAAAVEEAGELTCLWTPRGTDLLAGLMYWLPGGEWAATESRAVAAVAATASALAVPGLRSGDFAFIRCLQQRCWVDLAIDGNWAQIAIGPDEGVGSQIGADSRTAAVAVAEQVVRNLYG